MKRKNFKSCNESVTIITSKIRQDDNTVDCNELKDILVDEGAEVNGEYVNGETHMIVDGLSKEEVEEILDDYLEDTNCLFAKDYIEEDILAEQEALNDCKKMNESVGRKKYQQVIDVENESEDLLEDVDFDDNDEDLKIAAHRALDAAVQLGDEIDAKYIDDNAYELIEQMGYDADELTDEEFDHYVDILKSVFNDNCEDFADYDKYAEDDEENDYPEYDDVEEDADFDHLDEKKRGCCPPKNKVNEGLQLVLDDINKKTIAEKAHKKLVNEKLDSTIKNISNGLLVEKVNKALKENKSYLHENVKVNGKSLKNFSIDELVSLYKKINESIKSLNESADSEAILKREKLLAYINEEITYRKSLVKCINEGDSEISDDELSNLFGHIDSDDSEKKDEKTEKDSEDTDANDADNTDDEEVELSRIEITVKDADALGDLKDACVNAGIPEDAFECVGLGDEETVEDDSENDEESEETDENTETEEAEKTEEEDTNESIYYRNISRLFEDDEQSEDSEETDKHAETDEQPAEDSEEKPEDIEEFKFVLTNTDYAIKLADVLKDVYGISKEEFEDMIGGEIVEDDKSENSEEKEEKEETPEDKESDDADDIDPSELFKGL